MAVESKSAEPFRDAEDHVGALRPLLARLDDLVAPPLMQSLAADRILHFAASDTPVSMYLPYGAVDSIQRTILRNHAFYEAKQLAMAREHVRPGAVVVDAGANIGNHTIFF